jgi:hypothetical protein
MEGPVAGMEAKKRQAWQRVSLAAAFASKRMYSAAFPASVEQQDQSINHSNRTAAIVRLAVESKAADLAPHSPRNIHGPACVSRRFADQHVPDDGFAEGARCIVVTQRHAAGLLTIAAVNVVDGEVVDLHKPR